MQVTEHYPADLLAFFDGCPVELELYETLYGRIAPLYPEADVRVQKTQISVYDNHMFLAVSLPMRRKKDWPKQCILVTFGLPYRLDAPRIAVAVEPYPGRWTHHVLVSECSQVDEELLGWIHLSWEFAQRKR